MRTTRALVVAAATAAAVGLAAPAASAWDQPSSVTAAPSVIAPGGQLVLTVNGSACTRGGSISSNVFSSASLSPRGTNAATATVTVNSNAAPGSYGVITRCENQNRSFTSVFTVIGGVQGGLGGSSSAGATPADMAIGGGLVAAALVGGGVFWMRRRSETRI
ncbi:hypothetical protein [Streptomyces sp. AK08-02]|uniref:hypothetical protein n=1 Tax=Streptomyces sp. AK08-02 TaxID=3028654 RepID=UPI0029AB0902|nr:hypothetical protein [Streptomyces sp. AK08-02]MDX3746775.1 hypothetical protein [Streptomyces sp. AK08-02]